MASSKVRIMIDFPNRTALTEWLHLVRNEGFLPSDSTAFEMDAIDTTSVGVTPKNTYIVRRIGDRPEPFDLLNAGIKDDS